MEYDELLEHLVDLIDLTKSEDFMRAAEVLDATLDELRLHRTRFAYRGQAPRDEPREAGQ